MKLLHPEPGMVISYSYLWRYEYNKGLEEGRKIRPCVIILSVQKKDNSLEVTIAPITHTRPSDIESAIEIPLKVKQHLGLDTENSWVILNDLNKFFWPGYDLRPVPGKKDHYDYGFLPPNLFNNIKSKILYFIKKGIKETYRN